MGEHCIHFILGNHPGGGEILVIEKPACWPYKPGHPITTHNRNLSALSMTKTTASASL